MFDYGLMIFLGLIFIFMKLPNTLALRLLGWPLALDIGVSTIAYVLHWGTFSGVMVAAIAGMLTSVFTSCARKAVGYIENGMYYPGIWNILK